MVDAITDPIVGQATVSAAPALVGTGVFPTAGFRYFAGGLETPVSGVLAFTANQVLIQSEEAEDPPDRIVYDGTNPAMLNSTGGALQPFDEDVPFP